MLTIARKKAFCKVLGQGTRSAIWFYGCSRRCSGCIADSMNVSAERETLSPTELADWVLFNNCNNGIEGVTLSGGEPFLQPADELAEFLTKLKSKSDLSVICYTGFRHEDLADWQSVLQHIDVLIDGEYRPENDNGEFLRGSSNQRFIFLTERYRSYENIWNNAKERQIEIELDVNGKLLISGVPSKDFLERLTAELGKREINVDFS